MKTIKLKEHFNKTYYLTSITTEQKETLLGIKEEFKSNQYALDNALEELYIEWGIHCKGILKIGETKKITLNALYDYIESFQGRDTKDRNNSGYVGFNRERHYRNYTITLKKQKDSAWVINHCPDKSMSVKSALTFMDKDWTILWETETDGKIKKQMDKLLKNKLWCKVN